MAACLMWGDRVAPLCPCLWCQISLTCGEGQDQLFCWNVQQEAEPAFPGPVNTRASSAWLSDFITHGSYGLLNWYKRQRSTQTSAVARPQTQTWPSLGSRMTFWLWVEGPLRSGWLWQQYGFVTPNFVSTPTFHVTFGGNTRLRPQWRPQLW